MSDSPKRERRSLKPGRQALRQKADTEIVSAERLRQLFNEAKIMEKLQAGKLFEHVVRECEPNPDYKQDPGTKSQYVEYRNEQGKTIAEINRYLRADNTLGASGQPDPKMVFYEGVSYYSPP